MTHWRELSGDPNARVVQQHLRTELLARRRGRIEDAAEFLRAFVADRTVLDVGVVQHSLEQSENPLWKHGRIRAAARRAVGVDILAPEVAELNRRGFDVRVADATSDADLGERFERVVVGDVVEHVDNPVALLRFCARHLAPAGRILCTTPNPFFVGYLRQSMKNGVFVANAEHVTWISPSMAVELGHRADLDLVEYWHVQGPGRTVARRAAVLALSALGLRDSELFTANYYYVFGRRSTTGALA